MSEPIARRAYASLADRYAAPAPTKPHNGLYERPATMGLLGRVDGQRILDAGCGPGINSEDLARRGALVHGFDVTPEMIELAQSRCRGLPVEFQLGDLAEPLDWLEDNSFDKVLCALALDYVEELPPVLREFRRVVQPGGALVFSMAHPMSDWTNPEICGEGVYYERARYGIVWKGFGEPYPFVEAFRRPLAEIVNALSETGWMFNRLVEPRPVTKMKEVAPQTYAQPAFMCIRALRPNNELTS